MFDYIQFSLFDLIIIPMFVLVIGTRGFKLIHVYIAMVFYINLHVYRYASVYGIYTGWYSIDHLTRLGAFQRPELTEWLYTSLICACLGLGMLVKRKVKHEELITGLKLGLSGGGRFGLFVSAVAMVLFAISICHLFDIDKSVLWHNMEYTAIKKYELAGIGFPPNAVFHRGLKYVPLIATMFLMVAQRKWVKSLLWFVIIYAVFLNLASNSRSASISLGLLAFLFIFRKEIRMRMVGIGLIFLAFLCLVIALDGRGRTSQGIVGMVETMESLSLPMIGNMMFHILATTFNGAIVVSTGLANPADHGFLFKVLSFSPFPSLIDGFGARCGDEIVRLTANNPQPALAEVFGLGYLWTIMFFSIYFGCLFFVSRAYNRFGTQIAIAAGLPLLFIGVLMQIYPLRAVSKLTAASILIILAIEGFKKFQFKKP